MRAKSKAGKACAADKDCLFDGRRCWSYVQLILGWMPSIFAFYVFLVELTNNIYQRTVFPTYKWSEKHSLEEAFGAAGRMGTLQSRAAVLRQANLASFARRIRTTLPKDSVKQE